MVALLSIMPTQPGAKRTPDAARAPAMASTSRKTKVKVGPMDKFVSTSVPKVCRVWQGSTHVCDINGKAFNGCICLRRTALISNTVRNTLSESEYTAQTRTGCRVGAAGPVRLFYAARC